MRHVKMRRQVTRQIVDGGLDYVRSVQAAPERHLWHDATMAVVSPRVTRHIERRIAWLNDSTGVSHPLRYCNSAPKVACPVSRWPGYSKRCRCYVDDLDYLTFQREIGSLG